MAEPYKVWHSILDERTTLVCIDAHGQVVPPDEPFDTLSGDLMGPPAHWRCRSVLDIEVVKASEVTRPNSEGKRYLKTDRPRTVQMLREERRRLGAEGYADARQKRLTVPNLVEYVP